MQPGPFLRRLRLKNFRSIGECDVELGQFTILVGRNGAGKSNVLDSLRFVMESLEASLNHAIKSRGGITEVIRKGPSPLHSFAIQLDLEIDHQPVGYGFEVSVGRHGGFVVSQEALTSRAASYRVREGTLVHATASPMPPAADDRLYLVHASGLPEFRGVYDKLLSMGFYNLSPDQIRKPQAADEGELLYRDGSNIASVIGRLAEDRRKAIELASSKLQQHYLEGAARLVLLLIDGDGDDAARTGSPVSPGAASRSARRARPASAM